MKKLFLKYQEVMWYTAQFSVEYSKAGRFVGETLLLMTFLSVRGIEVPMWAVAICYPVLILIASGIGKVLTVLGVAAYNNKLSNKQNPEIMEILERLKRIEEKL